MRGGAGRELAGRLHRDVRREDRLDRLSRHMLDTVVIVEGRSYPLAPAWSAGFDAIAALDDIGLEGDGSRPAV